MYANAHMCMRSLRLRIMFITNIIHSIGPETQQDKDLHCPDKLFIFFLQCDRSIITLSHVNKRKTESCFRNKNSFNVKASLNSLKPGDQYSALCNQCITDIWKCLHLLSSSTIIGLSAFFLTWGCQITAHKPNLINDTIFYDLWAKNIFYIFK